MYPQAGPPFYPFEAIVDDKYFKVYTMKQPGKGHIAKT
jgi:hypothetical protein